MHNTYDLQVKSINESISTTGSPQLCKGGKFYLLEKSGLSIDNTSQLVKMYPPVQFFQSIGITVDRMVCAARLMEALTFIET